jgi:outer membrane immunogenic protein
MQLATSHLASKKLITCLIGVVGLIGTPAFAADMAVKAPRPQPAPAPVYSWTGFYVGGNVGYAWSRASMDPSIFAPNSSRLGSIGASAIQRPLRRWLSS